MYRVYIADKFTRFPLAYYDVRAITKRRAKTKIFKQVLKKDKSYLLIVSKMKGGADNGLY
jgi:hypothetical protein